MLQLCLKDEECAIQLLFNGSVFCASRCRLTTCRLTTLTHLAFRRNIPTMLKWVVISLLCVLSPILASAPVFAQATRIYVAPQSGSDAVDRAITEARTSFVAPLTAEGSFALAADMEIERLVADCLDEIVTSPTERRRCRLMVARREFVTYLLVLSGRELGGDRYEFGLEVIDPERSESPFVTQTTVTDQPLPMAVRYGLQELADEFIAWSERGDEGPTGYLEIMRLGGGVDAGTACINGETLGPVPGQYRVSSGLVRVEVSAVGFIPFSAEVDVRPGELFEMPEIPFEPVPATLHVSSNIHRAQISIDGHVVGTTRGNGTVRLEVPPGSHSVEVTREGYHPFSQTVAVDAGAFRAVAANLEAVR